MTGPEPGWLTKAVMSGLSAVRRYVDPLDGTDAETGTWVALTLLRPGAPPPADEPVLRAAVAAVAARVRRDMALLGVPGEAHVDVTVETRRSSDAGGVQAEYALRVNGRLRRCPSADVADLVARAGEDGEQLATVPWPLLPEVAAEICAAAVLRRPSMLLTDQACTAVLEACDVHPLRRPAVAGALRSAVDNGVSITDRLAVAEVVRRSPSHPIAVTEALIDRLRPSTLDLLLTEDTLRRVTTAQPDADTLFTDLRTRVYADLGLLAPDFRFRIDDTLPAGHVAFGINALRTRTWALPPTEPLTAIGVLLEAVVRRHASWFLSLRTVDERVRPVEWVMPDTVGGSQDRCPEPWRTALARAMLAEHLTVLYIPTLLDRLLDIDPVPAAADTVRLREGPTPVGALGTLGRLPSPEDAVSLLRQRQFEGSARMQGRDRAPAHHDLSASMEAAAAAAAADPGDADRVVELVSASVRPWHAADPTVPLVVRSLDVRSWLARELRAEFPDLVVRAAQEMTPTSVVSRDRDLAQGERHGE